MSFNWLSVSARREYIYLNKQILKNKKPQVLLSAGCRIVGVGESVSGY